MPNLLKTKRNLSRGKWTHEEHLQFINSLKTYGKDWDKIDQMIPTRSSIQIRSHAQKYFAVIKKTFNSDDPVKLIQQGMLDQSPFYKFDNSEFTQSLQEYKRDEVKHQEINPNLEKLSQVNGPNPFTTENELQTDQREEPHTNCK